MKKMIFAASFAFAAIAAPVASQAETVDIATLKAKGYNLDQKNPHSPDAIAHDPDALLAEYGRLTAEAQNLRDQLKGILAQSLGTQA